MDKAAHEQQTMASMNRRNHFPPIGLRSVEMLVFPAVQILDVTGPLQVFASANEYLVASGSAPAYDLAVVTQDGFGVTTSAGVGLAAGVLPGVAAPIDTLLVPGGPGVAAAATNAVLVAWLQDRAAHARRVASVCSGAYLLAAAGLLDGRRAATHWSLCSDLAERYPTIQVEPDPIFVRDGPVWTSAGVTSGIDLALALVEEDLGRSAALAVARYLVVFLKRPGGQSQFSAALALQSADDRFGALHEWIAGHLNGDLSLGRLAARAGMSERSFSRRYVEATGQTPAHAVERLRVDAARRMLSESRVAAKRIATRCGFGSEETMRRSFVRLLATTPKDFRARFSP